MVSYEKIFHQDINIHESVSFHQVDFDIWHFSNVGIMIMIMKMNVLWENLKSINNISWASLMHWKWFQTWCGDIKETQDVITQHIWNTSRYAKYKYYKNKEHTQRHICVSFYLYNRDSETGSLTWWRFGNIYKQRPMQWDRYLLMGEL